MNLYFVKTFLEVVAAGNLNQAADRLHVTQSTVTTRINSLEEMLGQKLLIRNRSGVELTSAGFKFQRYAELLLQTWNQANYELSLPSGYDNICNLGCHVDLWEEVGSFFLDEMRQHFPKVAISTWAGSARELSRWLETGLIDLAFSFEETVSGNCHVEQIMEDELILVSTKEDQKGMGSEDYIYVDMGPEIRRQHAAYFSEEYNSGSLISTPQWAMDHILKWGGSSYLPRRMAMEKIETQILFEVEETPAFHRAGYVISNLNSHESWSWYKPVIHTLKTHLGTLSS